MPPAPVKERTDQSRRLSRGESQSSNSRGCSSDRSASDFYKCGYINDALSILVVGASGDLAAKKTYASLLALFRDGYLPEHTIICGYARSEKKDDEFRKFLSGKLSPGGAQDDTISRFLDMCIYRSGQYNDANRVREIYKEISNMESESKPHRPANRLFYFAVPPSIFPLMGRSLKSAAESDSGWNRYIVEKPFGRDSDTFEELNNEMNAVLKEENIYRIDHFLGKEIVQNLLMMRFGNSVFEPVWNHRYVSNVIISFKENFGTQGRGGFFDSNGIIRDIMANHLIQVLSLFAMEAPTSTSGNAIRDEKRKVLDCIPPIRVEDCIIGQYTADDEGKIGNYTDDDGVPDDSKTPTYAACVLYVNNPRWDGVPFILRAGKSLNERKGEIRVQFKDPPGSKMLFPAADEQHQNTSIRRNELVIKLQPHEAVYMKMNLKSPGLRTDAVQTELDLSYKSRFASVYSKLPDAYTRLILQVLRGDGSSFVREDELRSAWKIFTPLLHAVDDGKLTLLKYKALTRGPDEYDEFAKRYGFEFAADYKWAPPSNM